MDEARDNQAGDVDGGAVNADWLGWRPSASIHPDLLTSEHAQNLAYGLDFLAGGTKSIFANSDRAEAVEHGTTTEGQALEKILAALKSGDSQVQQIVDEHALEIMGLVAQGPEGELPSADVLQKRNEILDAMLTLFREPNGEPTITELPADLENKVIGTIADLTKGGATFEM